MASGFYWTAGKRSLCFSRGYVPALKIGATDNKGRAPVAVFTGALARKLTPREFLLLQGFDEVEGPELAASTLLRMAGNAVPRPVGHFVIDAVARALQPSGVRSGFGIIAGSGTLESGLTWVVDHEPLPLATNLEEFLDNQAGEPLSAQAAAGLIVRCVRSGNPMPRELFDVLWAASTVRTEKLRASRANSFDALDSMTEAVAAYAARLPPIACYEGGHGRDADDVEDEGEAAA